MNSSLPNPAHHASPQRRAIGITRVSQEGDRETVHSYATQAARIQRDCEREGVELLYVGKERNVSGGSNLSNRPELSRAVAAVENGEADVIVAAYFDRFFRSLKVQGEVIERIEQAGGEVLTLDHGTLTNATPAKRLQANIVGAMSEFFREQTKEKSAAGQAMAVADGRVLWSRVPLGYTRDDGRLFVDDATKPIVQRAFEMRASGESASKIRAMLKSHGIERSHRGVQVMLANRVYLGEVHFGKLVNLHAHEPIIERELFGRVQRMIIPRGRQPGSTRLLARLGVLRCGSCGARLGTMKLPQQKDPRTGNLGYPIYRCPSSSDCDHHVTISATIAERVVTDAVKAALANAEGRASAAESAQEAVSALESAQAELEAAVRSFAAAGLDNETVAVERLDELRQTRDDAQVRVDQIGPEASRVVNADENWDDMSLDARRALIRATIKRASVAPTGRGAGRISVEFFGQ
jgi:DNA invertase Pin-like site-specific DNA recombinase